MKKTLDKTEFLEQISEYIDFCRNVKVMSEGSIRGVSYDLRQFMDESSLERLQDITNRDVNDWISKQHVRGCKASSINTRIKHLACFITWHRDMNLSMPNLKLALIVKLREDPPRRVWYTREEINKVLTFADRRAWLMIRLTFECGLRISELTNLRLENIRDREIQFVGKCRVAADLYMSDETRKRLDDWIAREQITNYLWRGRPDQFGKEKPLHTNSVRRCMEKTFLQAGHEDFYPHALRHSFATEICFNGASKEEAQELLRHSSVAISEIYIHSFGLDHKKTFDQFVHCKQEELR